MTDGLDGQIHTTRLSYIADEIERIQGQLIHTRTNIQDLDKINGDYRKFMETELKAIEKRLCFELQKNIDALIRFTDELKPEIPKD